MIIDFLTNLHLLRSLIFRNKAVQENVSVICAVLNQELLNPLLWMPKL